ncbi:putative uracil phosphoribosyltransferase urg2 [Neolecta irregularis DAH-3]|uniref:uracil phosphoribosyltransferase n=1 Tax=Neolecta irregularis (strain DAH-3) TaxID=1198029 RepID=A0A1U7LKU9_NEOID|nr:putative uracil phosphoribosyltransferase urg2 [Neolecta irregularis DAH-3]|eukprot:OLL23151.1 putative uracil phosphoribosyltransferase urg2 [Neolecta irregularis DAH-3]
MAQLQLPSNVRLSSHPLLQSKLSALRDSKTTSELTRLLTSQISTLLAVEATKDNLSARRDGMAESHLGEPYNTLSIAPARLAVMPVLRAGLGMTDAFMNLLPVETTVHHIGLFRERVSLQPVEYYNKLPQSDGMTKMMDIVFVLDPVIATGGTAGATIQILKEWGVGKIVFCSILASADGIQRAANEWPEGTEFFLGGVDADLNFKGYIIPGVGDLGDRLNNT